MDALGAFADAVPHARPAHGDRAHANHDLALGQILYKVSRATSCWPDATPRDRCNSLLQEWLRIVTHRSIQTFEDMLDAVICAWVAIRL